MIMNSTSVQHNILQNQELPSWNDDPFNLKGLIVQEATTLSHSRNMYNYAEELISNYANYKNSEYVLNLEDLPLCEQQELARLYIEFTDRDLSECIYGDDLSINSAYTSALLAMISDNCAETRNNFAEVTINNILIYYKQSLQSLLDDACHFYLCNINHEQGLFQQQSKQDGEF